LFPSTEDEFSAERKDGNKRDTLKAVSMEKSRKHSWGSMFGSHLYDVNFDLTNECFGFYGIFKEKAPLCHAGKDENCA